MSIRTGRPWRPVTLRARLLAGILLLLIGGLALSDVAATAALRHFLILRVDQQLTAQRTRFERLLTKGRGLRLGEPRTPPPAHDFVAYLAASGQVLATFAATEPGAVDIPPPQLPRLAAAAVAKRDAAAFSVPAGAAESGYRVVLLLVPGQFLRYPPPSGAAVSEVAIAAPLNQVDATVGDLFDVDLAVSSAAVVVMALLGSGVLRLGLRPIAAMARAGQNIAEGDRLQRLPIPHPESELGRLAGTLNQAFDERASSEERLRRFVADASHELRTPLTTVRAWADLYQQGGVADRTTLDTAMKRIGQESARMGRLVDDLLGLARLEAPAPDRVGRVDAVAVAAAVVADAKVEAADRAIEFSVEPDSSALVVQADPDDLHRVVRNLVSNAIQHTVPGTAIEVRLRQFPAGPGGPGSAWVELSVRDHGAGVPLDERERIFDPFVRLAATPRSASDGAGLGLAIVRATVASYGGTVTVLDAPSGGAAFQVRLPAARSAEGAGDQRDGRG